MPEAVIHPTMEELVAFGLGKLPERAAAVVAAHLESCTACRHAVAGVSADSFLNKVRDARQDGPSFALSSVGQPPRPAAPSANLPPELAHHPKYQIIGELGRGGMGVVYQARHKEMERQVVIKVINRALLDRPDALERFRREIRAAAQLSHPNIVTAYDAEQVGELHMLVMEFVPGRNLTDVVRLKGALPISIACHFARQVALGLQHAYERGLVHRDIKPQNLMLTRQGQVKILDFGLAKLVREERRSTALTSQNAYLGTPDYCAPEQASDAGKADIRADLYSLGCTLYCLLAGHPPFQEDTWMNTVLAHIQKQPRPLPELRPEVTAELWQVVARLLAKDPAQRYEKPSEVAQALAPFTKSRSKQDVKGVLAPAADVSLPRKGTMIAADTGEIRRILREVPGTAPPKAVPAKDTAVSPFANLTDTSSASKNIVHVSEAAKPYLAPWWKRPGVQAAAVGISLSLVLMAVIIKFKPPEGTIAALQPQVPPPLPPKPPSPIPEPPLVEHNPRRSYKNLRGNWKIEGNELVQQSLMPKCLLVFGDFGWKDYDFTIQSKSDGKNDVGLIFRATGKGFNTFVPGGWVNTGTVVEWWESWHPIATQLERLPGGQIKNDTWQTLRVSIHGTNCKCFVDGNLIHDREVKGNQHGAVGLRIWSTAARFRNVRVTDPQGVLLFQGLPELPAPGDHWPLAIEPASTEVQQIRAVANKLKELNPGFDGAVEPTIENGVVTGLEFVTDHVTDISPLRALPELKRLSCRGSSPDKGKLTDLSPLRGMKLVSLNSCCTEVSDISPLKDMKLKLLFLWKTKVSDLSPLTDMNLMHLDCNSTLVRDLSPLRGMELRHLNCTATKIKDLSPLKDMKLEQLYLWGTSVADLSPLKGMQLTVLSCSFTPVCDLSPLKGMPLTIFWCEKAGVTDLSPLKGMPLKTLACDFQPERDTEILRSIEALQTINGKPVAEVLKPANGFVPPAAPAAIPAAGKKGKPDEAVRPVDERNRAINAGITALRRLQHQDGTWSHQYLGATALAGLTLLECGADKQDEAVLRAADAVRKASIDLTHTYSISLSLLFLDRLGDREDEPLIESLTVRLLAGQDAASGGWSYGCPPISEADKQRLRENLNKRKKAAPRPPLVVPKEDLSLMVGGVGDNSNTQFAALGLWVGRRHGAKIEGATDRLARRFRTTQLEDGGWHYSQRIGGSTPSMTCAGLIALAIADGATLENARKRRPNAKLPAISNDKNLIRGLEALGAVIDNPRVRKPQQPAAPIDPANRVGGRSYYFLWSLERVATALDLKTIGKKDWYLWGAEILLENQMPDGSWRGDYVTGGVDTCFALLFLKRANLTPDLTALLRAR